MRKRVFLSGILSVFILLCFTNPAWSANQVLGGVASEGELRVTVYDSGRIGIERYVSGSWQQQVYDGDAKGSYLFINGAKYEFGYYSDGSSIATTYDSNTKSGDTVTLTRHTNTGVVVSIAVTYTSGTCTIYYEFNITNQSGGALSNLRFFHGDDTYLGGQDDGAGTWDGATNTVGVEKDLGGETKTLKLTGITAPFAYESREYAGVYLNVADNSALTNTLDTDQDTDNGYALEWRTDSLANGATWTIDAEESIGPCPPTITDFTPKAGSAGTTVTITGAWFAGTEVKFGGTNAASFTVDSPNQISAMVGSGSTGKVTVTTDGGTANSAENFTYVDDPSTLDTGTPTSYKVTVTKVRMHSGAAWQEIFSGSAELNMAAGGTFPGISNLNLPVGTYDQVEVTFKNAFTVSGGVTFSVGASGSNAAYSVPDTLTSSVPGYYTTATAFFGQSHLASTPTTTPVSMAEFSFYNPAWGVYGADAPPQTYAITLNVGSTTNYQPTLRFTISDTLLLKGTLGFPSSYFLSLGVPTVTLVQP